MNHPGIAPENHYKIIIVGGGPGGLTTALHLAQKAPELINEILILEAKAHPRPKLCGGGVTIHGEEQLEQLGINVDVPAFEVHELVFQLGKQTLRIEHENAMRVFDRAVFDAALAQVVEDHDLNLHSNERLLDLEITDQGVILTTDKQQYAAQVIVAADGAKSVVRRKLKLFGQMGVARLLRIMTPIQPEDSAGWQNHTAVFDFTCVQHNLQGYVWDFPVIVDGQPFMNRGIFDSRIEPAPAAERAHDGLRSIFAQELKRRGIDLETFELEGHPVRWFNPSGVFSMPRVVLVGDAAGVDPLFAEGISYAMEYGAIAADSIKTAFETKDFQFADYRQRLLDHRLGRLLARRTWVARTLYRYRYPVAWSILWQLAQIAPLPIQRRVGASLALLPA